MKPTKSYLQFIDDLKKSILQSRYQATRLANREQLLLYFKTGKMLSEKVAREKWGAKVLEQLSNDLQISLPGIRGFSYRNLKKMKQFYDTYETSVIGQLLTAQLQRKENQGDIIRPLPTAPFDPSVTALTEIFLSVSFTHHILLLNKCRSFEETLFYLEKTALDFWSVTILEHNIDSRLFEKQGKLPNNFTKTLSADLRPSAVQLFNDEYLLDYMNLGDNDDEREVENKIVANIRDFILRMGKGFSFIGNQFRVELAGDEFFIDLLFFNRHLRCLVAFELKKGKFKPEYAGKLNFYLNVLDEKIKLPDENNSIGIVLCKEKNNTVVEYSVKTINKAMGVATFKTTRQIPPEIKSILPDSTEIIKLM
ncbi:MAG: PDDEXK nuclease domain-containing protein [Bacteroidota bacterium]